jgi:hypothetical protein
MEVDGEPVPTEKSSSTFFRLATCSGTAMDGDEGVISVLKDGACQVVNQRPYQSP